MPRRHCLHLIIHSLQPPPPQSANPSYQAPFYQMQSMFSSPFMSQVQNQLYPQSSGVQQSYQSSGSSGYYPVAQQSAVGGGSGCCGGMMCFTGDTLVTSMNGTKIRMDELTVNDWVLTGGDNQIGYSKINSWLHRKPKLVTEFIKFTLENGIELKMTKKHYIFKSDCSELSSPVKVGKAIQNMVYAENVTINDCLFVISPTKKLMKTRVSKIEKIKEKGIYSPMTNNGNIIVNDVFASCFNIVQNDVVQITFPSIIKKVSNHLSKILNYFIGFSFGDYYSYQLQKEIELIPGLSGLVEIVKVIVPKK
uniref:Hint domain-containing protein n=1 Tax=Panagrolaimus sp. PS1159 TaxID=55785 RepID=A0AC35GBR0_9BILA